MKRYLRVKYEDLLDNPMSELERIYKFMSVSIGKEEREAIHGYFQPHDLSMYLTDDARYYGVRRGKGFDSEKWRNYSKEVSFCSYLNSILKSRNNEIICPRTIYFSSWGKLRVTARAS